MHKGSTIAFPNGLTAKVVWVERAEQLAVGLRELGLEFPRPTLVLVGGAGNLPERDMVQLRPLFAGVLAPLAEALGACVVDGGTDAGVMHLMGEAYAEISARFPLIGVASAGTVALPNTSPPRSDAAALEAHHGHFVLTPGEDWGDEAPWLTRVASVLAKGVPSVTVLVNGGRVAMEDVLLSVRDRRPVIVVAGSGRLADVLAGVLRANTSESRARELAATGLLQVADLTYGFGLAAMVKRTLTEAGVSHV
jgi:hypothetical protein